MNKKHKNALLRLFSADAHLRIEKPLCLYVVRLFVICFSFWTWNGNVNIILFSSYRCARRKNDIVHTLWICINCRETKISTQNAKLNKTKIKRLILVSHHHLRIRKRRKENEKAKKTKVIHLLWVRLQSRKVFLSFPKLSSNSKDFIDFVSSNLFAIYSFVY